MIKPLPGYCLVEPIKEDASVGGVYVPENIDEKPMKGKIVAISEPFTDFNTSFQTPFVHSPVKIGQTVCFKKWTNQEVKHEGKEYLLVKFDELLAVVE